MPTPFWVAVGFGFLLARDGSAQAVVPHRASTLPWSSRATQPYVASDTRFADSAVVPPNLIVPAVFLPIIESMLETSPTFRRQCLRLAAAGGVIVAIGFDPGVVHPSGRARAYLTRTLRGLRADITIFDWPHRIELIAHEFEHVIEQLDDIDLSSKAALASTGVERQDESFETERAVRVGLAVAREVFNAGVEANRSAGRRH